MVSWASQGLVAEGRRSHYTAKTSGSPDVILLLYRTIRPLKVSLVNLTKVSFVKAGIENIELFRWKTMPAEAVKFERAEGSVLL